VIFNPQLIVRGSTDARADLEARLPVPAAFATE
jgi:hypothetical protein